MAHHAGICGLVVPDIIPEESVEIEQLCRKENIDLIHLLAPTSTPDRQRLILKRSRGVVYLVSVAGVTGTRKRLPKTLSHWVKNTRQQSRLPVAVGFGISSPQQARQVARVADGVIVGSAIIEILRHDRSPKATIKAARLFLKELKEACTNQFAGKSQTIVGGSHDHRHHER